MSDNEHVGTDDLRERAVVALKKRRDLLTHVVVYLLVNSAIVSIWWATGHGGFFWPVFFLVFWGIGLVMNAWDVFVVRDPSEERIRREMHRLGGR